MQHLVHVMGPTCAGKSTLISTLTALDPCVGAVEVGKMLRAKYGEAHFKGQMAPSHTQNEALALYKAGVEALLQAGRRVILVDGQPRAPGQVDYARSWRQPGLQTHFWLVTAPLITRETRARAHRKPGPDLDLALSRLQNDYRPCYDVICELLAVREQIRVIDTAAPTFEMQSFCENALFTLKNPAG